MAKKQKSEPTTEPEVQDQVEPLQELEAQAKVEVSAQEPVSQEDPSPGSLAARIKKTKERYEDPEVKAFYEEYYKSPQPGPKLRVKF
jgi:hypothetical protein